MNAETRTELSKLEVRLGSVRSIRDRMLFWFWRGLKGLVLVFFTLSAVFPVVYVVSLSIRPSFEVGELLPKTIIWTNYPYAWTQGNYSDLFKNSLIVTISSVVVVIALAALAGYAFARHAFKGRNWIFQMFLLGLAIPGHVVLIPLFISLRGFQLLNTYFSLILPYVAFGLPFSIYLLTSFFKTLPRELEDAARIDGCTEFQVFYKVMLPLARPALATVAIFEGLSFWNEFLFAVTFIHDDRLATIPLGLKNFQTQFWTDYAATAAAITIATVPIVLFYVVAQRHIIQGLTAGAVKG